MVGFGNNYYVLNAPYDIFFLSLLCHARQGRAGQVKGYEIKHQGRAGQGTQKINRAGQVTGYQNSLTCRALNLVLT